MVQKRFVFGYGNNLEGRCHDCGVLPGEIHHTGCDVEVCPWTFRQRVTCSCGKCSDQYIPYSFRVPFGFEVKAVRDAAIDRTEEVAETQEAALSAPN